MKNFKGIKLALGLILVLALASCTVKEKSAMDPSGFKIQRGVNLSHWLSQDFG